MIGKSLKEETIELFRKYRESHRDVFLDESLRFIRGVNHTIEELAAIRKAAIERGKILRLPNGTRCGRRRSDLALRNNLESGAIHSKRGDIRESFAETEDLFDRDWAQHGNFRSLCMSLRSFPATRPLLLNEILAFIHDAGKEELANLRNLVAHTNVRRPKPGRRNVLENDEIMHRALLVVWMRLIDEKSNTEIAKALGMRLVEPRRNAKGLVEIPGNTASISRQLRRLEGYLAAAIWNAIPPSYIRTANAGNEIAPGGLGHKRLQTYIRLRTGLPFHSHPEECKRVVEELWSRGAEADWELTQREFNYRQKKSHSLPEPTNP